MAEKLTPPPSHMPTALFDLGQETRDWFENDSKWKVDVNFVLKLGDAITNITNSEAFETSSTSAEYQAHKRELEQIEDQIPTQRVREFTPIIKSSSYTAINGDFVEARSRTAITLDGNAGWNDQIITAIGDSTGITIKSDIEMRYKGKRSNNFTFGREGSSIHWYLFTSGTEKYWRAS